MKQQQSDKEKIKHVDELQTLAEYLLVLPEDQFNMGEWNTPGANPRFGGKNAAVECGCAIGHLKYACPHTGLHLICTDGGVLRPGLLAHIPLRPTSNDSKVILLREQYNLVEEEARSVAAIAEYFNIPARDALTLFYPSKYKPRANVPDWAEKTRKSTQTKDFPFDIPPSLVSKRIRDYLHRKGCHQKTAIKPSPSEKTGQKPSGNNDKVSGSEKLLIACLTALMSAPIALCVLTFSPEPTPTAETTQTETFIAQFKDRSDGSLILLTPDGEKKTLRDDDAELKAGQWYELTTPLHGQGGVLDARPVEYPSVLSPEYFKKHHNYKQLEKQQPEQEQQTANP